ncbi:MAG TPA: hypothetical protein VK508_08110 [Cyclobacteriaceae bacterium]|nr:hypothetical protein [Cyclobacteriaceae bacterium]
MKPIAILIAVCSFTFCIAQKKIASAEVSSNIVFACVDRPGDLYVVLADGQTLKYDKTGKQIGRIKFKTVPTVFDPKDGTRAFAYFRDSQTIESIAPDLSFSESSPLHAEFAVSAWLVCPSKNEFWILDSADVTMKKTKERGVAIAYESEFSKGESDVRKVVYMREYLNFLFVLDSDKGIHVLNNLGRSIRKIDGKDIPYFSFLGEEIYYASGNTLQLIDLYNTEKREITLPHSANFALLTDDRMILVTSKTIDFFEFVP